LRVAGSGGAPAGWRDGTTRSDRHDCARRVSKARGARQMRCAMGALRDLRASLAFAATLSGCGGAAAPSPQSTVVISRHAEPQREAAPDSPAATATETSRSPVDDAAGFGPPGWFSCDLRAHGRICFEYGSGCSDPYHFAIEVPRTDCQAAGGVWSDHPC